MKITEDTKIKDLIPEGYEPELSSEGKLVVGYYDSSNTSKIIVIQIHKKKEVKDFKWYAKDYTLKSRNYTEISKLYKLEMQLNANDFDSIPFELKIGLLKFICDDIECDWKLFLDIRESKPEFTKICAICPAEFLNSIFK